MNLRLTFALLPVLVLSGCLTAQAAPRAQQEALRWYKGNTHTHSLWSHDADGFPEMIADWYKRNGYHFLALTDHNVISAGEKWMSLDAIRERTINPPADLLADYVARFGPDWVQTRQNNGQTEVRLKALEEFRPLLEEPGQFLLIQGEEVTSAFRDKPIHFNAINLRDAIPPRAGRTVLETMRNNVAAILEHERHAARAVLFHLNHPNYRWAVTAEQIAEVRAIDFVEIYNGIESTNQLGDDARPGVERLWDIAITLRIAEHASPPPYGVAVDDSHQYFGGELSPGRGWIMVRSAALTPAALIAAMRRGDFYASTGVTLRDVRFDARSGMLRIEIDPVPGETYTTTFHGTRRGYDASSHAPVDDEGAPSHATRVYSADVGQVLAVRTGTTAIYRFRGDELYVRATVTSDRPPDNPSYPQQRKQAWTQPVGWSRHVDPRSPSQLNDHGGAGIPQRQ